MSCKLTYLKLVINVSVFSGFTLMSSKTNNLACAKLINHSLRTHTTLGPASRTEHRASLVHGFWIAQLRLLLSALTHEPSPLCRNGHICCSGSEAEIVLRPGLTETDCAVGGPRVVMSLLCARNQERPLESRLLSSYAMPQVAETQWGDDKKEFWSRKSKEYHMSGIKKWLHNGSSLSLSLLYPPALSAPCFCQSAVLWCLSYHLNSSSKLFDQVVWPTTHSRRIVNVSMCLLLCIELTWLKRINGPIMKLAVRWLIHFSNLEMRPIGRESLSKQNLFCFEHPPY